MKCCSMCGQEFEDWELQDGICSNCLASIVHTDGLFPNESDFECS